MAKFQNVYGSEEDKVQFRLGMCMCEKCGSSLQGFSLSSFKYFRSFVLIILQLAIGAFELRNLPYDSIMLPLSCV